MSFQKHRLSADFPCQNQNSFPLYRVQLPYSFSAWNSYTVPRLDDYEFAKRFLNEKHFCYDYRVIQKSSYNEANKNYIPNDDFENLDSTHSLQIIRGIKFKQKNVKRLYSERNIFPEKDSSIIQVDGNGNGASNIINKFINKNELDSSKVQNELLERLNEIMINADCIIFPFFIRSVIYIVTVAEHFWKKNNICI